MVSMVFAIDNETKSFYPGDKIKGLLKIRLASSTYIKGITLNCIGKSEFAWNPFNQVHFKEKIDFLETRERIFENGSFVLPFSFQLPSVGLPSTFLSQYGKIGYYLNAVIKTQRFERNVEEKYIFDVIGAVDLNSKGPVLQKATEISELKNFSCSSGSVQYCFIVSKTAFVPGEFLCFQVDICNNTNKPIDVLLVNIVQEIAFTGKLLFLSTKRVYTTFMDVRGPRITPMEEKSWKITEEDGVVIEQLLPTRRRDVVRINYAIQVVLQFRNGTKVCGYIPIVIGTIPFRKDLEGPSFTSGIRKINSQPFRGKLC